MPLEQCKEGGRPGWRWGASGVCFTGPGAKKKAIKVGLMAEGPEGFKEKVNASLCTEAELNAAADEILAYGPTEDFSDKFFDAAQAYVSEEERKKMSLDDFGWPEERKFPVRSQEEVDAAAKLIGRAPKDKQKGIKERIIKIAKKKGLKVPESWK